MQRIVGLCIFIPNILCTMQLKIPKQKDYFQALPKEIISHSLSFLFDKNKIYEKPCKNCGKRSFTRGCTVCLISAAKHFLPFLQTSKYYYDSEKIVSDLFIYLNNDSKYSPSTLNQIFFATALHSDGSKKIISHLIKNPKVRSDIHGLLSNFFNPVNFNSQNKLFYFFAKNCFQNGFVIDEYKNKFGNTLLIEYLSTTSSYRERIVWLQLLLEHGANPNLPNPEGLTSMMVLFRNESRSYIEDLGKLLIKHGADIYKNADDRRTLKDYLYNSSDVTVYNELLKEFDKIKK